MRPLKVRLYGATTLDNSPASKHTGVFRVFVCGNMQAFALLLTAMHCTGLALFAVPINCRKATAAAERLVCSEPMLLATDRDLDELYRWALQTLPNAPERQALRETQRSWSRVQLLPCKEYGCAQAAYGQRIRQLAAIVAERRATEPPFGRYWFFPLAGVLEIRREGGQVVLDVSTHNPYRKAPPSCTFVGKLAGPVGSSVLFADEMKRTVRVTVERGIATLGPAEGGPQNDSDWCGNGAFLFGDYRILQPSTQ